MSSSNKSSSHAGTATNERAEPNTVTHAHTQHEGQGGLSNSSGTQHLNASIGIIPLLPVSVRDGSGALPRGTSPPGSQLLELPAATVPRPSTPNGSLNGLVQSSVIQLQQLYELATKRTYTRWRYESKLQKFIDEVFRYIQQLISTIGLREMDIPHSHQRIRWTNVSGAFNNFILKRC